MERLTMSTHCVQWNRVEFLRSGAISVSPPALPVAVSIGRKGQEKGHFSSEQSEQLR